MAEKPSEKRTLEQRLWEIALLVVIWFAVFSVRSYWVLYAVVGGLFGLMLTRSVWEEQEWLAQHGPLAKPIMVGTVLVGAVLWPVLPFIVLGRKLYKFMKRGKE